MRLAFVLVLAACSHGTHGHSADASNGADGSGAGGDGGVSPNDVRVLVHDGFTPIANVRVVFAGADGTQTETTTDALGVASASMPSGGDITVIRTYPIASPPTVQRFPEIYSYVGVVAGDTLHVGHALDTTTTPTPITVSVPIASQGTVQVVTACGAGQGTQPSVVVPVTTCPPNVTFYIADAAQEGFALAAPYAPAVDLADNALAQFLSTTLFAYNVTPDLASVTAEARAMDGTHALYSTGVRRVDRASVQQNLPDLELALDELVIGTRVATAGGTQVVARRFVWAPTPVSIDASANVIPYLQPPTFAPTTITWVETGTGTANAVLATIDVTRGGPNVPPADAKYRRAIIAPHGGASLAIPQLAGADATYNPGAADKLVGTFGLVAATGGYDALRPWAFGVTSIIEATKLGDTVTLSYAGTSPPTL
jgi:hypothetical protein